MKQKRISLFTVLMCLAPLAVSAATLQVPQQFRTIYEALLKAQPGDTVLVAKGEYHENIAMVDDVVIRGEDQKTTIINGGRKGDAVVLGADRGVIENFTIKNGRFGILCKATAPIIQNCIIIDNKGSGVMAVMGLPQINNCIIMRNRWSGVFLQSVKAIDTQIENNVILENGKSGVHCANATQVLIRNNILMNNDEYGIFCDKGAKRTRIVFNNFFQNLLAGTSFFAIENKTNMHKIPMFRNPTMTIPDFDYYVKGVSPMVRAGENNIDIGLLTAQQRQVVSQDRDNDGIPDDQDQCPDIPEDVDGWEDEDGCPDYDNDNDGIYDSKDQCSDKPEDKDGFEDEDGCPDADNDKDGVSDSQDGCPNDPETVNAYKDDDGCPDEPPQEIKKNLTLEGINFRTGSAELLDESYMVIDKVFNSLEAFPKVKVEIRGHTDNVGAAAANMMLSQERAQAVKDYLVNRGVDAKRIKVKGIGEGEPVASNRTAAGREKNRRIEFIRLDN
ncbi:MAG: OmpA family protein [Fibrobacteres bacterium]|nr:OmpA family protein [Fibrobacterota bacterium]